MDELVSDCSPLETTIAALVARCLVTRAPDLKVGPTRTRATRMGTPDLKVGPTGEGPVAAVDPDMPFALLGLDSLRAIELAVTLEEALGFEVTPDLLSDCTDVRTLAARLRHGTSRPSADDEFEQMMADAVLPDDIRPVTGPCAVPSSGGLDSAGAILLTGATGFLGLALVRELLERSPAVLFCLARPGTDARARLLASLESAGVATRGFESRIHIVLGDLRQTRLGLTQPAFDSLAGNVEAICHAGATVNWVSPYSTLRASNVIGTLELLRLACRDRALPFHFVSSLSVCYSSSAPPCVDEGFDALSSLRGVHLGYAQTKIVAESLVRQAGAKGLPVAIYRPALISGDSRSGAFNHHDVLAALIKGCVQMGSAPDLDWQLDCLPVDVVATAVVRLSQHLASRGDSLAAFDGATSDVHHGLVGRTFHLSHPRPRHWRECVLWMRLYGYPIRLVSYHAWLRQLERETAPAGAADHPLRALRSFFLSRPSGAGGLTLPELYEDGRRTFARAERTEEAVNAAGLVCPPLDAILLDRYFAAYVAAGHLPAPDGNDIFRLKAEATGAMKKADATGCCSAGLQASHGRLQASLGPAEAGHYRESVPDGRKSVPDDGLWTPAFFERALGGGVRVRSVEALSSGSDHSIISELAGWRTGRPSGLFRFRLDLDVEGQSVTRQVIVKVKPPDTQAIEVGEAVARLCGDAVGEAYATWGHQIGLAGSHARELAIYAQDDPRFTRHTPAVLGSVVDEDSDRWILVLERVTDAVLMDSVDRPQDWSRDHVDQAIRGLASLHGIWDGRETALSRTPWIGHVPSAGAMQEMSSLWTALAEHAAPAFSSWADPAIASIQRTLIADVGRWWQDLDRGPRTLIHHDFNPRNICLRRIEGGVRLCAYDWELATLGAPQHDLAELLCFLLPPDARAGEIDFWIERHRAALARETGCSIDPELWRLGFRASVYDLLVNRLAMYALIHRIRRQTFLPRVVRTWRRLYEHVENC